MTHKNISLILVSLLFVGCGQYVKLGEGNEGSGGGDGGLGGKWQTPQNKDNLVRVNRMSHTLFSDVMKKHSSVTADKQFVNIDYKALAADSESLDKLSIYLGQVAGIDASDLESESERLAYWANGYNASVMSGVLNNFKGSEKYRVIDAGDFFTKRLYVFGGVRVALDEVEHGVVRGTKKPTDAGLRAIFEQWHKELWNGKTADPRIHAMFNCAAKSCPNLPGETPHVYAPTNLEKQIAAATTAWLGSAEKGAGSKGISKLFDWYKVDFGGNQAGIKAFLDKHRTGGSTGVNTGTFLEYDWTLNIKPATK